MPFDKAALQKLMKNKLAVGGVVAAAAVGGFVLYKRKSTTGSSLSGSDTAGTSAGQVLGPGTVNTTGDDVAAWLGNYSGNLQNITSAWGQQLTDAIAHLPTADGGTGTTSGGGWALPGTAGYQPKPTGSVTRKVQPGDTWLMYLKDYFHGGATTNTSALESWSGLHGGVGTATLIPGQIVKLPTSSPGYAPGSHPGV